MKKVIFGIMVFFITISVVYAKEELVISDLQIQNGEISPKFDKYNNYYSVTIEENVDILEMTYTYDETYEIKVTNNEDLVDNKLVYVTINDIENDEQNTYIFKIYVNEAETTANEVEEQQQLNIDKEEETNYAPIVGTVCFILIILAYYVIFLR